MAIPRRCAQFLMLGPVLLLTMASSCPQIQPTGPQGMTATSDTAPDNDTVQVCITNNVANHTLSLQALCKYFDQVNQVGLPGNDPLNDRATITVPSGATRYVVCQFRKTSAFTDIALTLTSVDTAMARITFDQDPTVFEDLPGSFNFVTDNPKGIFDVEVQPGQQLQLSFNGTPGAVTQQATVGTQTTLPASQTVIPE
jgi:hypothetical protein